MFTALRRTAAVLLATLLASCGGGTSQITPFKPPRVLAFGDELSAFTSDGRKYAVNGLASDGTTRDCTLQPLWIQDVATLYGFGFAQCPVGTGEQKGISRAAAGARAAEVVQQVDAQVAAGGFLEEDLVLILAGANDVLQLYAQFPGRTRDDLIAQARASGEAVARQVNRMAGLGARVIVSTIPDMGLTPYGIAQGTEGAKLLSDLSAALNGRIRVNILNDGRYVGLVLADEFVQTAARAPGYFSLSSATVAACKTALPDCTSGTLVDGATADTYLWADDRWMSRGGHRQLGALAGARATLNPF